MSEKNIKAEGYDCGGEFRRAKEVYAIDPKTEPLLASLDRLGLLTEAEKNYALSYDPKKTDYIVCRLDKEGKTKDVLKMSGAQLRQNTAIIYGLLIEKDEVAKRKVMLDADARDQLHDAMANYKFHTYDKEGRSTGTSTVGRYAPNSDEESKIINQALADYKGSKHFRTLEKYAADQLDKNKPKEEKKDIGGGMGNTGKKGGGRQSSNIPAASLKGIKDLDIVHQLGQQIAQSTNDLTTDGTDARTLAVKNATITVGSKSLTA